MNKYLHKICMWISEWRLHLIKWIKFSDEIIFRFKNAVLVNSLGKSCKNEIIFPRKKDKNFCLKSILRLGFCNTAMDVNHFVASKLICYRLNQLLCVSSFVLVTKWRKITSNLCKCMECKYSQILMSLVRSKP